MRRSRSSAEQIIEVTREHGFEVDSAEICCKQSISDAILYNYKVRFGGMKASDAQRLRTLEAERLPDNAILTSLAVSRF